VTVTSDGVALGEGTLRNGKVRVIVDTSSLAPGTHTLTVAYSGDEAYEPGEVTVEITVKAKGKK